MSKRPRLSGFIRREREHSNGDFGGQMVFRLNGRQFVRVVRAKTKREALRLLADFVNEVRSGALEAKQEIERLRKEAPTLGEWAPEFLRRHINQDGDRGLSTRATYDVVLRSYLLPAFGDRKMAEVKTSEIRDCLQDIQKTGRVRPKADGDRSLSLKTMMLIHGTAHRLWGAAIEDEIIPGPNPVPPFKALRLGKPTRSSENAKRHAVKAPQVQALLAVADIPEQKLSIMLMFAYGLRPGECAAIKWSNVQLTEGVLHVEASAKADHGPNKKLGWGRIGKTKNDSSVRTVAMGDNLKALFIVVRDQQEKLQRQIHALADNVATTHPLVPSEACVFPADVGSLEGLLHPVSPAAMRGRFAKLVKAAGLKGVTPHWGRHTAPSNMIAAGWSVVDVSKVIGHSNPNTTLTVYAHSVADGERRAAIANDGILAPAKAASVERLSNPNPSQVTVK